MEGSARKSTGCSMDELKGRSCLYLKSRSWLLLEQRSGCLWSPCSPAGSLKVPFWVIKNPSKNQNMKIFKILETPQVPQRQTQDLLFQCIPSKLPAGIRAIRSVNLPSSGTWTSAPSTGFFSLTNVMSLHGEFGSLLLSSALCRTQDDFAWAVWCMCWVLCVASVISNNTRLCLYEIWNFLGPGSDSECFVEKQHKSGTQTTLLRAVVSGFWSLTSIVLVWYG